MPKTGLELLCIQPLWMLFAFNNPPESFQSTTRLFDDCFLYRSIKIIQRRADRRKLERWEND